MIESNMIAYILGAVAVAVLSYIVGDVHGWEQRGKFVETREKLFEDFEKMLADSKKYADEAAEYYECADKRYKEAAELLEQTRQFLGIEE